MIPRYYQTAAKEAVIQRYCEGANSVLAVIPTGCGKSYVIADFCMTALHNWPGTRIVVATHSRDLVSQDYLELIGLWPEAPAGIYSAGLNRRDLRHDILFVGIQSIYNKAFDVQRCDVLLIDEAHSVSRKGQTMWGKFIADLKIINPHMKIFGLSATPFRMDSGSLIEGDDRLFEEIAYEYSILEAVKEGYLCEVIPKHMDTRFDVSGVSKRGGEFVPGELERAVNIDHLTQSAVAEIVKYGENRGTWLCFGAGVDHSHKIAEAIRLHGVECAVITGDTPAHERDQALRAFKDGRLRAISNRDIMTTGTNVPRIDLIAGLRHTGSAGLFIQMVGRGSRLFPGKENCLYLDFANCGGRFGPIDQITARRPGKGGGEAPVRVCDKCHCVCHAGCRICPDCGQPFPEPEIKVSGFSYSNPILSTQVRPEWRTVIGTFQKRHVNPAKPLPTMKVTYYCMDGDNVSEWLGFEHSGRFGTKARAWHARRSSAPIPATVDEAVANEYPQPSRILVKEVKGKLPEILEYDFEVPEGDAAAVKGVAGPSAGPPTVIELEEYEIPW